MLKYIFASPLSVFLNGGVVYYYQSVSQYLLNLMKEWNPYIIYSSSWLILFLGIVLPMFFVVMIQIRIIGNDWMLTKTVISANLYCASIFFAVMCVVAPLKTSLTLNLISMIGAIFIVKDIRIDEMVNKVRDELKE